MATIADFFKKHRLVMALVVFIASFLLGWLGMGWGLWPVRYVNGSISQLRPAVQQQYVVLVADSYAAYPDTSTAAARIQQLGPNASEIISDTLAASTGTEAMNVSRLQRAVLPSLKAPAAAPQASLLDQPKTLLTNSASTPVSPMATSTLAPGATAAPTPPPLSGGGNFELGGQAGICPALRPR